MLFFVIPLVTSWLSEQAVQNAAPFGVSALWLSILFTLFVGIALNFALTSLLFGHMRLVTMFL